MCEMGQLLYSRPQINLKLKKTKSYSRSEVEISCIRKWWPMQWALQISSRSAFILVLTLKSQAILNMQSVILSCHTLIVGASDCGRVGEYFVLWFYFLYSVTLFSKRRYFFWENVLWVLLYWWKHFELIKYLNCFDSYFLSYHIVFKKLKVVTT